MSVGTIAVARLNGHMQTTGELKVDVCMCVQLVVCMCVYAHTGRLLPERCSILSLAPIPSFQKMYDKQSEMGVCFCAEMTRKKC